MFRVPSRSTGPIFPIGRSDYRCYRKDLFLLGAFSLIVALPITLIAFNLGFILFLRLISYRVLLAFAFV